MIFPSSSQPTDEVALRRWSQQEDLRTPISPENQSAVRRSRRR